MGFRFRRSIKILPGLRINLGKRGASLSIGPRGFKTTIGPSGVRRTVGIPGTGLSYTTTSSIKAPKTGLNQLTVVQLKEVLRSKGLPVSGRKEELIERIYANFTADELGPKFAKHLSSSEKAEKRRAEFNALPPEEQTRVKKITNITILIFAIIIIGVLYFILS